MSTINKEAIVIIDLLYDFIDGSLACNNGLNAVNHSIDLINSKEDTPVIYICDSHPYNHCSFKEYGGIWPAHCVKDSRGSQFHQNFYSLVKDSENRPNQLNIFKKGENPNLEEYSGYNAKNINGTTLSNWLKSNNITTLNVSGVATEYCINETITQFKNNNFDINLLEKALSYVDYQEHKKFIQLFINKGINII